jgi:arylsulfatase A-like enzyme
MLTPHTVDHPARYQHLYAEEPEPERTRLQMCHTVDDMVARIADRLRKQGQLNQTLFIVLSDNGYHSKGEHGVTSTKGTPYAESLRVTMRAMGPGISRNYRSPRLICPQDIGATIVRMAEGSLNGTDGIDFTKTDRPYRLIQYHDVYPLGSWYGLAGATWTYVEWNDGRRSYFDRIEDPTENTDFYDSLEPERQQELATLLQAELRR